MTWYEWYLWWGVGCLCFWMLVAIGVFLHCFLPIWYERLKHPAITVKTVEKEVPGPIQWFPAPPAPPLPQQPPQTPIWIGPQTVPQQFGQPWVGGGYTQSTTGGNLGQTLGGLFSGLGCAMTSSYADLHKDSNVQSTSVS
jgi:hypothetical protein